MKRIIIGALCALTALTTIGCDYRTSEEENDAYWREHFDEQNRRLEQQMGLQPGTLVNPVSGDNAGAASVEYIRNGMRHTVYPELNIANRWQVRFYRNLEAHGLEFHSNACKRWSKFWQPVQNQAGLRIWADKYQDEVAKPQHKRNLKEVMRDLDGAPVVLHGCYWNPQYRRPK